jgi:hypothetical protein
VRDLVSVDTPPTLEYALMLSSRLDFIRKQFLSVAPESLPRNT